MDWNKIFIYDNGILRWRNRRGKAKPGSVAGCVDKNGYVRIRYNGVLLLAHRIIWEMHNGKIPEGMEIDHIWHNRRDNRIENLRLASRLENSKNVSLLKRNKSGRVGVCWRKKEKKWHATIYDKGKSVHLGLFSSIDDAIMAREQAEAKLGYHENHGK